MKNPFCYSKPLCSSFTHPLKWKCHFFPYALLWFTFPNSKNISCAAGVKSDFFVYNNMMAVLGMTPEETCVHDLYRHRHPLQSQVKCSVFPHGHRSLCWGSSCDRHSGNRRGCGADKTCARTAALFQQLHGDLAMSLWLTQGQTLQCRTQAAHVGLGHPTAPRTCPSSSCPPVPLQCCSRLCFGTRSAVWRTDCKQWHKLNTTCMATLLLLLFWPLLTMYP